MGEPHRSRYLERQNAQVRAGARLVTAAALILASSCMTGLALFSMGFGSLGAALAGRSRDHAWQAAATVPPWLLLASTFVLAIGLVSNHRWLWPSFGAWITALTLTVGVVWVSTGAHGVDFAIALTAVAIAIAVAMYWAMRRFGTPAA